MRNSMTDNQRINYLERLGIDIWYTHDSLIDQSSASNLSASDNKRSEKVLCDECNTYHLLEDALESNHFSGLLLLAENSNNDNDCSQFLISKVSNLVEAILYSMNLKLGDVAISVTCCRGFSVKKINNLQPQKIVIFGEKSAQIVLESKKSIHELRQTIHFIDEVPAVVTFHPNEIFKNSSLKKEVSKDLDLIRSII